MILTKEEIRNMINMLRSPDVDNRHVAFKVIEGLDPKTHAGEIMVLFRYGDFELEHWEQDCKKAHTYIIDKIQNYSGDWVNPKLSSGEILSIMTLNNASVLSIELFLEYFIKSMTKMLEQMGYPADKFELEIKLKEDGQSTKS